MLGFSLYFLCCIVVQVLHSQINCSALHLRNLRWVPGQAVCVECCCCTTRCCGVTWRREDGGSQHVDCNKFIISSTAVTTPTAQSCPASPSTHCGHLSPYVSRRAWERCRMFSHDVRGPAQALFQVPFPSHVGNCATRLRRARSYSSSGRATH